jgi:hypothetical protein
MPGDRTAASAPARPGTPRWIRRIGVAVVAAVLVGVPAALLARLLMRLATLAVGGLPGPVTVAGTAGIVVAFVVLALPATLVMAAWPRWARWTGAVFAVAFTVFPSGVIAVADLPYLGLLATPRLLTVLAVMAGFVVLVATYGQLLARLVVRLVEPATGSAAGSGAELVH